MIVFDIEPLQNSDYRDRGIGRYVRNLLATAQRAGITFKLVYNPLLPLPSINRLAIPESLLPATRENLERIAPDWLVTMSPFEKSLGATARLFRDCCPQGKVATIVYDLIPFIFELDYLRTPADRASYGICLENAKRSDLLLSISEHTASDVLRHLDLTCPVVTIGTGVDELFFDHIDEEDRFGEWVRLTIQYPLLAGGRFLFTVSGGHKSKNLRLLLEAYADCPLEFRMAHPLVIGGGMHIETRYHFMEEWTRILKQRGAASSEILILPHLADDQIKALYKRCRLFIYPSLYEGFGLPLAEALVSGTVCVASDSSSLREIMPLEDFSFSPNDRARLTHLIVAAATDRDLRHRFLEWAGTAREGLRWTRVGERLREALPVEPVSEPAEAPPLRTCIIGPLPPAVTGIGIYNEKMLPYLVDSDTVWFTPDNNIPLPARGPAYPRALLEQLWPRFSRAVYVIGNSFHHLQTLDWLNRVPGLVWLHDVRLSGLAWDYANHVAPGNPWPVVNNLIGFYPGTHRYIDDMAALDALPFSFAKPLFAHAQGFIVHSEQARQLLTEDLADGGNSRPIYVIPHAVPPYAAGSAHARAEADEIVIGLLGFMAPIRSPEVVIDAAAVLAKQGRATRIEVIGNCDEGYGKQLARRAAEAGIGFSITGFLDNEAYHAAVARVDVVVQIRGRTNGESSGTVANALAYGTPVITNIPSVREFWGECTVQVSPVPTGAELAEKIRLCCDPEFKAGLRARSEAILPRFSFEAVADRMKAVLNAFAERDRAARRAPQGWDSPLS